MDLARFRYKEKGRPDDYASSVSARMAKPFPKELILAAASLTYPWAEYKDPAAGERKVREYLESFRIDNGRVLLMAKADVLEQLEGEKNVKWEAEPWYGTLYHVKRFDEQFVQQASPPTSSLYTMLQITRVFRQMHPTISPSCSCPRKTSLCPLI